MKRARLARAVAACVAMATGYTAVVARADTTNHASGDCVDMQINVPVNELELAGSMPAEFVVPGTTTHTVGALDAFSCSDVVIDGQPSDPFIATSLGLAVIPPSVRPDHFADAYFIWRVWNSEAVYDGFNELGVGCRDRATFNCLVRELTFDVEAAGTVTTVEQTVPWDRSAYSMRGTFVLPAQASQFPVDVLWHRGVDGYVREKVPVTDFTVAYGLGEVAAASGSLLADVMGTTAFAGPAQLMRYHFEADLAACASPQECV